jgi:hypothetical protein
MVISLPVVAMVAFAAMAVDDVIILTTLFPAERTTGRRHPITIIAGQYSVLALPPASDESYCYTLASTIIDVPPIILANSASMWSDGPASG